ncbi:hypothetical protein FS749_016334 [Ceratobasidium sp. UAMH 11750]|nr:hypothetical protein FS749_016334 [Ceratobasidium sp. UAMH 11750]
MNETDNASRFGQERNDNSEMARSYDGRGMVTATRKGRIAQYPEGLLVLEPTLLARGMPKLVPGRHTLEHRTGARVGCKTDGRRDCAIFALVRWTRPRLR